MPEVKVYFDDELMALVDRARGREGRSPFIRRTVANEMSRHPPKMPRSVEILSRDDVRAELLSVLIQHFPDRFPVRETAQEANP